MTSERQNLDFLLARSGQFNPRECQILTWIRSYSSYCYINNLRQMASVLGCNEKTIRRAINSLVTKGIIVKKYCNFKKLRLEIVPLAAQITLRGPGMIMKALRKKMAETRRKNNLLRSLRTSSVHSHRTLVNEPRQNKDFENKTYFGDLKKLGEKDNRDTRDIVLEQIAAFKASFLRPAALI